MTLQATSEEVFLKSCNLLTEKKTAEAFGCSINTIREFAAMGILTPFVGTGNGCAYSLDEIINKFANEGSHEKANRNGGIQA